MQDAWVHDDAVRAIAAHPAVLDVLRLLYEREPFPFQTLSFLNGTEQRTHSGVPYTPMFSQRRLGAYSVRRVRDARTGKWTVPSLDGTPVLFPGHASGGHAIRPMRGLAGALLSATMGTHGSIPQSGREALRLFREALRNER